MSEKVWTPTEVAGTELSVRVWPNEEYVSLEVTDTTEPHTEQWVIGHITPGQAVSLSRALVKAAAEALGVSV